MQKIGAVHFNPKIQPHLQHNDRTNSNADNIFKELSHLNECDKSATQALKEIDELYKESMQKLSEAKRKGKRTPKERSFHEAIFEIDESTTMQQCQELADKIAELTGFRKIQISIHRDEGHKDEAGNFKPHYHAHAVFFTLDKNTGKQLARQEASLNPRNLSKIQDLASEILQMKRGERHFKDSTYQAFLDTKASKPKNLKISYKPQAPSRIQNQDDFKRYKEQFKETTAQLADKERFLTTKDIEIKKRENSVKNLEYQLNEQKRTLNQSFEKTLTELHLKQENRKKGLKNAFLNVISFGYYFKKIDSDTKKQENALLNTLQNAREEASITYKELEKANTGLLETKKRLESELAQEKAEHINTKNTLKSVIQKSEYQQKKAKELLNPTDYAKLYTTNAQNTHLRDKRQGVGR